MTRSGKLIRNIVIIMVLGVLLFSVTGLYLTPLSAHRHSEEGLHYGPSRIVRVEDYKYGKYYLGKFDKWFSCTTVNRSLGFFWSFGGGSFGKENDSTKAIDFLWDGTLIKEKMYMKVYGVINDSSVKRIEITKNDGGIMSQSDFYDNMFLFQFSDDNCYMKSIRGYDENEKLIFEQKY